MSKEVVNTNQDLINFDRRMQLQQMQHQETMAIHDENVAIINGISNGVYDICNVANNLLDVVKTSYLVKRDIALIHAVKEVQLDNLAKKYELSKMALTEIFGQRQRALNENYAILHRALEKDDRELVITALQNISNVVTSKPLEDFSKFLEAWDDTSKPLELDF